MFLETDNGANATTGTASAQTGTASQVIDGRDVTSQTPPPTPWDSIPWEELDDSTKRTLETARNDHQRVAGENATLRQQSEARQREDQQRQQQQQRTNTGPTADPYEIRTRDVLKKKGFTDAQVDAQAPVLAELMKEMGGQYRHEIGQELGPIMNRVVAHENTANFETAQNHPQGQILLQEPAVAEEVWKIVDQRTAQGQTFGPDAILNLAKIVYQDHQFSNPQQTQATPMPSSSAFFPTVSQTAPINRNTGFSYPGAHARPIYQGGPAPTHGPLVNEDTRVALAATFEELKRTTGVAPKAFPGTPSRR